MKPVIIKWETGEMHLTADFFTQGVTKARKAFRLLIADPEWDGEKVRELAEQLLTLRQEKKAEARDRQRHADELHEKLYQYRLSYGRGPYPASYHALRRTAAQERETALALTHEGEVILKVQKLLLDMWEAKNE